MYTATVRMDGCRRCEQGYFGKVTRKAPSIGIREGVIFWTSLRESAMRYVSKSDTHAETRFTSTILSWFLVLSVCHSGAQMAGAQDLPPPEVYNGVQDALSSEDHRRSGTLH